MKNSDEPLNEPGPPFAHDDPIWDKFYGDAGTGRLADLEVADRALSAYVHAHPDICMELDSAPGCWHCRAWTAEEHDGEHWIMVRYEETKSPTPMAAVEKAIALLNSPVEYCIYCGKWCDDSLTDDRGDVFCSNECMTDYHAHLDLIAHVAGQYEPGRLDHLRWESPPEEQ